MSFSAASSREMIPRLFRIFLIFVLCCETSGEFLFKPGKQYLYKYYAETNTGVLLPSKAASSFGISGNLKIEANENSTLFQLQDVRTFVWNGEYRERTHDTKPCDQIQEMSKPFRVNYRDGLVANFSIKNEPAWATNIKRSIAGILQLDFVNLEKQVAFHSVETNHYGQCTIEYVVTHENDNEKLIRKFSDPRMCLGHPHWTWTNVPRTHCPNDGENPVIKSSERLYKVKRNGNESTLIALNATGGIYVQPFQSLGESQFAFTRQLIELISTQDMAQTIVNDRFHDVGLQHELPDEDLTQGRNPIEKEVIFSSISKLLDRLSQRLENPGLDTDINNLHNTTISVLLYYLGMLDQNDLKIAYNKIAGTSYKEETVRNMFLETLPQVGTKHSALFVLDLILKKKVSDITAMQLLTYLPFNIRKPSVDLLTSMKVLLDLPSEKISLEVRNTGILTFGTLIYKTCLVYCPYETLDDYVRLYLDRFTETSNYDKKMVWLEGLSNIQLGRVVEFLEPIASGNSVESRHLRVLAAWASLPTAPLRPDVIYPVYWPIFVNRTEHLELRIAALTLLMVSNPSANRMISLYWYLHDEPDRHLYHFFYTTLKSLERNNFPCYKHLGGIAAQFTRVLRKPLPNENIVTGNYLFDYQDTKRHFGAMVQNLIIANPRTNIPEVVYMTLISHGSGTNLNHISLYVKAEGLPNGLSTYLESPTRVIDILKDFKIEGKPRGEVHLEIIARVQQKAVFCLHFNQSSIETGLDTLRAMYVHSLLFPYITTEFHINQQRINIPLIMESLQVTELGTNVRLAVTATSLFSMRGNFTYQRSGRNCHVIIRSVIHGRETIESYNPFVDVWHGAERAQSIHGYLPINITIGADDGLFLLYNTPAEYLRTGITANVRTATSIRGRKAQDKLRNICPECTTLYNVRKSNEPSKNISLFAVDVPELGGRLHIKVFDCEGLEDQENFLSELLSAHRSNYQTWPAARLPLVIVHILDFFTYVPPRGSCGLSVYVEPGSLNPSEVKLKYVINRGQHSLGLIRREIRSQEILQEWTLTAVDESTDFSKKLKVKAVKIVPGEKVVKVCVEAEAIAPWAWDFLSIEPSEPASVKLNIIWGLSDKAVGKCSGSEIFVKLVGEVTKQQIEGSKLNVWPYQQCRKESQGKSVVPYTDACYEASRELSTLRKYEIWFGAVNPPESLRNFMWRLQAFYNVLGGNSSVANSNKFVVGLTFPKNSKTAEIKVNNDKISIGYDPSIIDLLLERTRLHRFLENSLLRTMFSVCTLTRTVGTSADNVTFPFTNDREILLLAHCYKDNPRFALRAIGTSSGITIMSDDDLESIKIVPDRDGGKVYNFIEPLPFKKDFQWNNVNSKRIRMDGKSIHLFFSDHLIFIHVTADQVLVFFPSFMKELPCGVCTVTSPDEAKLFEKN